ncbi:MAG TPA: type III-B CRISPR module RAMP protein Cmr4 [Thermoanaerobaculia bacterium]|jgi:CRISPR-associated protein Cmr4
MSYLRNLIFFHTITPLHVGCGQDVGVVDLPVIRERTTGYPFIPGSGLRGSLRDLCSRKAADDVDELFGPDATALEDENASRHAGCVAVHDAHLLLFPVRSQVAPFLWITCPAALRRFSRHAGLLLEDGGGWQIDPGAAPGEEELQGSFQEASVYLEEIDFTAKPFPAMLPPWLAKLAAALEAPEIADRAALVSDATFHYFVTHATQVIQHNRLTAAKTVAEGQLFSVEAVPPEAYFYGFLGAADSRKPKSAEDGAASPRNREAALRSLRKLLTGDGEKGTQGFLQLGGDEGTGLGVTRAVWTGGGHGS